MEVESLGGPDKNRVYGLSNTTVENLRATRSVSIVGSSQSVSSTQSKEFVVLQQHTAHLIKKYEQLSMNYEQHKAHLTEKYEHVLANYEQLQQMVMNTASQSGDTCAPFFGSITTSLLLLLQLCHCANLIYFWKHIQFVMNII